MKYPIDELIFAAHVRELVARRGNIRAGDLEGEELEAFKAANFEELVKDVLDEYYAVAGVVREYRASHL